MTTLEKRNSKTTPSLSDVFFGTNWADNLFANNMPETDHFNPSADIIEKEKAFLITIALPGMTKKDIKLDLVENKLTVSGNTEKEKTEDGDKFVRREIVKGSFHREFRLGNHIDAEQIEASFKDGLLNITLPKSAKASPKTISIK